MNHRENDLGIPNYFEERNIVREKMRFLFTGLITLSFISMVVYVGSLHSTMLMLLVLLLFGWLIYPALFALILGLIGIHRLEVYESGFYPPHCSSLTANLRNHGFILWKDVDRVYVNKNLRISKLFPYLVVKLKNTCFGIPAEQIINMSLFLDAIKPFTRIITDSEHRCGTCSIDYLPPSIEARLDDDAIVLTYRDEEKRLEFSDIKKVRVSMNYQLLMNDGKRIGLLGMSREDIERIKIIQKDFMEKGPSSTQSKRGGLDGVFGSTLEEGEGEGGDEE